MTRILLLTTMAALAACSGSHTNGGDGGGLPDGAVADGAIADGAIADGGIPTEDAGPAPDAGEIVCGGFGGGTCASDQYCDYDMGCGFADGTGVCRPRPTACPPEIRPTCGCNGMTYSSPCDAYAAGTDVLHDGACATPDRCAPQQAMGEGACDLALGVRWDGASCGWISGCSCAGPDCGALYTSLDACVVAHAECARSCGGLGGGTCADTEYCDYPEGAMCGAADETGVCTTRPTACTRELAPVCGCDGRTYSNACMAHAAGADVSSNGPCPRNPCDPMDARGEGACLLFLGVAWNGSACVTVGGCTCVGADCGSLYATTTECEAATAGCRRACGTIAGLTCLDNEYCNYPDGACLIPDAAGVCAPRPGRCPDVRAPVCGCDGRTYSNDCEAAAAGVDFATRGACSTSSRGCGARLGDTCGATEFCDFPDASMCGATDIPGVCRPRPEICLAVFDPVCGCDGMTYSNGCVAQSRGTDVASRGACGDPTPTTCSGAGDCAPGEECCAATGTCYDGACLSCCMFAP